MQSNACLVNLCFNWNRLFAVFENCSTRQEIIKGKSKVLIDAIRHPLKQAGFKKPRPTTWYRNNPDTISVLNLQCSPWGPQYYINISLWLKALGQVENPLFYKCHVRLRWGVIIPDNDAPTEALLDLENTSISIEERTSKISSLIESYVIPFFDRTTTLKSLRKVNRTDPGVKMLILGVARPLLDERTEHDGEN